jgi:uncharacterized PurR-regulated membrane protein YhhQ (DUF165 family)
VIWCVLYVLSIVAANWAITTFGLVPVGSLLVPAGSFAAGLTFGFRDLVQRDLGRRWTIIAILAGAALSALLSPALALASGAAFLLSELLDFAIYDRLRARTWTGAVAASNAAGSVLDTALFLWLAFGAVAWPVLIGTVLAKWLMIAPVLALGAMRAVPIGLRRV